MTSCGLRRLGKAGHTALASSHSTHCYMGCHRCSPTCIYYLDSLRNFVLQNKYQCINPLLTPTARTTCTRRSIMLTSSPPQSTPPRDTVNVHGGPDSPSWVWNNSPSDEARPVCQEDDYSVPNESPSPTLHPRIVAQASTAKAATQRPKAAEKGGVGSAGGLRKKRTKTAATSRIVPASHQKNV